MYKPRDTLEARKRQVLQWFGELSVSYRIEKGKQRDDKYPLELTKVQMEALSPMIDHWIKMVEEIAPMVKGEKKRDLLLWGVNQLWHVQRDCEHWLRKIRVMDSHEVYCERYNANLCVVCGQVPVDTEAGFDTCERCAKAV